MKTLLRAALIAAAMACTTVACSSSRTNGGTSSTTSTLPIGLGPTTTLLGAPSSEPSAGPTSETPTTAYVQSTPPSGPTAP